MLSIYDRWSAKTQRGDGCWLWLGAKLKSGYGVIADGGKQTTAHRVAWELASGMRIPPGKYACHKCDNPSCVRPDHLFVGTPSDNMQDCVRKGRDNPAAKAHWGDSNPARRNPAIRQGIKNSQAKLTEDQVREIRGSTERNGLLAVRYGVSKSAVKMIRTRRSWKSLA